MKKHLLITSVICLFASYIVSAQYTMLTDFTGNGAMVGPSSPQNDQNFISDGTYLYGMTYKGGSADLGIVFKIKISDNSYTKILDFAGATNGSYPAGSLISDGTYLYGMTSTGGTNNLGTVFKIKISDNTYNKLLDFAGTSNGSNPRGSLISDGTYLYGMTRQGGTTNDGTIFKISISGNTYTQIFNFTCFTDGCYPEGSLISDGTYLYGMTFSGGTNNGGTVFKIKISDNTFTKIMVFTGIANGYSPYGSLITDGTFLYGMTYGGGTPSSLGTAFKIKISDNSYIRLLDFDGTTKGNNPYGSLITDGTYLYGMAAGGGNNSGTAFKIKISDNSYTNIQTFDGDGTGLDPRGSLLSDGTYLYGMAWQGGQDGAGTAFKINISDYTFTKILDFKGTINGGNPKGSLSTDGTYLFGMASSGGKSSLGTAFKIKISDNTYTKLLDFNGTTNGSNPNGSLISDGTYLYGMTSNNGGTAFAINTSDNSYTKILDFTGSTGYSPFNSLISDGTYLYGMTSTGGTNYSGSAFGGGTVFKIKISDYTFTKILDFAGTATGWGPKGSLISDGTYLYGMTTRGGTSDNGTAFKITISDNTFTKILDFDDTKGSRPEGSFITDGTYLYGLTPQGGSNYCGTAFKIKISDNTYTKIFNFTFTANGFSPYGSLITDGTYLYGMTYYGGTNNFMGTLFKIKISDNTYTKIMDFTGAANGSNPRGSLIIDGNYLYGMTSTGGTPNIGTVFKFQLSPEINVKQGASNIPDNTGTYNFGSVNIGTPQTVTFTIENIGHRVLNLSGTPKVVVAGTGFTLAADASATISEGSSGTFQVTFTPGTCGAFSGTISIENDDADENPYNFAISGTGLDNVNPTITCPGDKNRTLAQGQTFYTVSGTEFDPTGTGDNCGVASVLNDFNNLSSLNGATIPLGTSLITWTITDNANNKTQCSFNIQVSILLGNELLQQNRISIYPNPANGKITISGLSSVTTNRSLSLTIDDNSGKTSLVKEVKRNTDSETIDVSSLANGVYYIIIQTDKEKIIKRFVKQ